MEKRRRALFNRELNLKNIYFLKGSNQFGEKSIWNFFLLYCLLKINRQKNRLYDCIFKHFAVTFHLLFLKSAVSPFLSNLIFPFQKTTYVDCNSLSAAAVNSVLFWLTTPLFILRLIFAVVIHRYLVLGICSKLVYYNNSFLPLIYFLPELVGWDCKPYFWLQLKVNWLLSLTI